MTQERHSVRNDNRKRQSLRANFAKQSRRWSGEEIASSHSSLWQKNAAENLR